MKTLYIDACAREKSRTRELADYMLARLDGDVEHLKLYKTEIPVLNEENLNFRTECCRTGNFEDPFFDLARQFAEADRIIIAAPYWDMSFPAILKQYIEQICVTGLTFRYGENGIPQGLCKAKTLTYITTAGGYVSDAYGFGYINDLAEHMFGIKDARMIKAEGLDIIGADVLKIMNKAKKDIRLLLDITW